MFVRSSKTIKTAVLQVLSASLACLLFNTNIFAEFTQFDATYRANIKGESSNTVISLKQNPNNGVYAYSTFTKLTGLFGRIRENSIFTFNNNKVKPTYYQHDSDDDKEIRYNWNKKQAISKIKKGKAKLKLKGMELDVLSMQMQITRDLKNDSLEFFYRVIEDNGHKTYAITELGEESFEFDGKALTTIKLEQQRAHSKARTVSWFAPELDYLLVKMQEFENDSVKASLDLISYNNLSPLPVITAPEENQAAETFSVPVTTN